MAGRIRTIKPELREHAQFAALTDRAARLFLMLYTLVDDTGRCPASVGYLLGAVFFARSCPANVIGRLISELEAADLVRPYEVNGAPFVEIVGWRVQESVTHQRIDKPQPGRYPAPKWDRSKNDSGNTSKTDSETYLRPPTGTGDRDPDRSSLSAAPCPAGWEPADTRENVEASDLVITKGGDLDRVLQNFRGHHVAIAMTEAERNARWQRWCRDERSPSKNQRRAYVHLGELDGRPVFGERIGAPKFADGEGPDTDMELWERYVARLPNGLFRALDGEDEDRASDIEAEAFKRTRGAA